MLIGQFKFHWNARFEKAVRTLHCIHQDSIWCIASYAETQSLQEFWVVSKVGIFYKKYCNVNPGVRYTPSSQWGW